MSESERTATVDQQVDELRQAALEQLLEVLAPCSGLHLKTLSEALRKLPAPFGAATNSQKTHSDSEEDEGDEGHLAYYRREIADLVGGRDLFALAVLVPNDRRDLEDIGHPGS